MTSSAGGRIALVCAADAAYLRPLAAMVQSVLANHRRAGEIDIFVLTRDIDAGDRVILAESWQRQRGAAHWLDAEASPFAGVPLWGRMPVTTYYKLAIADLLPPSVRRAIWLDCDLLVRADIEDLWDVDLAGNHTLAVQDSVVPHVSSPFGLRNWDRLGLSPAARYFNAGVMLVDVDKWRSDRVPDAVVSYLREHHREVFFWDQEGLNAVLAGRWGELDARWNCNVTVPGAWERLADRAPASNGHSSGMGPWVLHFSGNLKPWLYQSRDPRRRLFYEYLDQTPWSGWRPRPTLAGRLVDWYELSGMRRILYPAEQFGMRLVRALSRRAVAPDRPPS